MLSLRLLAAVVATAIVVGASHAEPSQTAKLNDDDVRQAGYRQAIALSELEVAYKKRQADAYISYLNNNVAALKSEQEIRRDIFSSQLRHHPWVLGSVIILVFAGVLLAYFQVLIAQRTQSIAIPSVGAASAEVGQLPPTPASPVNVSHSELEISRDKLVFRSHIVGLLILLISLGFFYLYLVYVYTIHPEGLAKPETESSAYQSNPTPR